MHKRITRLMRPLQLAISSLLVSGLAIASEPVELARGVGPRNPQQPQVAVDESGTVHVVYGVGDSVAYHRSDDAGKSYTKGVELSLAHSMMLGMRRGPRISATKRSICITAIGGSQGKGRDGDLLAVHSVDGGKSWSKPLQVNDVKDAAREGLHAMAASSTGEMCCTWLDLRNRSTEVMASTSVDGGRTWGKNVMVYKSPDGSVCECCHPSVAFGERGRIHVQWRNSLAGARDIYFATSTDSGKSFGKAEKLGAGSWPLDGCPMDGGAIGAAEGKIASAWRRENSIYLSLVGQDVERFLGHGEQPWIAVTKEGPFVVWLAKRGEAAYLLGPADKSPIKLTTRAYDPVIAANSKGSGPIVIAWESREGKTYTVHCRVLGTK